MSKQTYNNKKKTTAKKAQKPPIPKKTKIIITAAVAAVLLVAFVIGLVAIILSQREFDYLNDNLNTYIEIDKTDYLGKTITLAIDKVDDSVIERKILNLLYTNRKTDPENDGAGMLNIPVSVGDEVRIYYRGYTIDENGNEVELDNGSNVTGEIAKLGIGSCSFVPGFEEGLIGINPKNYPKFKKITSGTVTENLVIYLSGKAIYSDGKSEEFTSKRIDLSANNVEDVWGKDFKTFILGGKTEDGKTHEAKLIGGNVSGSVSLKLGEKTVIYSDLKIEFATDCETNPLTVETKFPADYDSEDLRGKTVFFDVYIKNVVIYSVPEYDDEFVKETLKVTEEDLADYTGETMADKYREKLKADLTEEYESTRKMLIEDAIWRLVTEKATYKKFPEKEVRDQYGIYYEELASVYQLYSSQYSNIGEFAIAYYGLEKNADWTKYLVDKAKSVVAEKLCFYYVIRENNLLPTAEEYAAKYEEIVAEHFEEYLENYEEELGKLETAAEKEKRKAEIKKEMLADYGSAYFEQSVYYVSTIDSIIDLFTVVEE